MREYTVFGNLEEIALSIDDLDLEMVGFKRLDN